MASLAWPVAIPIPIPAPMPVKTAMPAAISPIMISSSCQMTMIFLGGTSGGGSAGQAGGSFFFLDALAGEHGGQEHKDDRLDQTVEQIEVDAEHGRDDGGHQIFDDLHDDIGAQYVAEKTHAQGQRADQDFHQVDGQDRKSVV